MQILITGGAGFIGSHIADAVAARGHSVRILDALLPAAHPEYPDGKPDYLQHELVVGDVRDRATVDAALDGIDVVCHQAAMVGLGVDAQDLPDYAGHNDLGTAVLLAGMARADITRLVLASSMVVYGEGRYECAEHGPVQPGPRAEKDLREGVFEPRCPICSAPLSPGLVSEDSPLDPRNAYAASKVAQEHLASSWARSTGGSVAALRYHNVYGPRMPSDTPYAGVASIFRSALRRGVAPRVFEDGGQRRDFVHVRDIAAANVAALGIEPGGLSAFNVCSGVPHTVGDMASALAAACAGPSPVVTGEYRLGDVRHVTADPAKAAQELGFRATIG
ncbi:MAG TPA: NAD-dependent epimerase/dehydratase family protein, partial [Mycobacteriales bacterium]|nr:NAD-dependent epimerase/dehydratase family protein [Mycobacteriales bacterium]